MPRTILTILTLVVWVACPAGQALAGGSPSKEAALSFGSFEGCFLSIDLKDGSDLGKRFQFGTRCEEAVAPCSTFKVINALVALDSGVVKGLDETFKWDGTPYRFKSWSRNQTFQSAFRYSVLWVFQRIAERVGAERYRNVLAKLNWPVDHLDERLKTFWIDGSLKVTPLEQLNMMVQLFNNRLPFPAGVQAKVRELMDRTDDKLDDAGGKTGTCLVDGKIQYGWYVGFQTRGPDTSVYVTLIHGDEAWGYKAREIGKALDEKMNGTRGPGPRPPHGLRPLGPQNTRSPRPRFD